MGEVVMSSFDKEMEVVDVEEMEEQKKVGTSSMVNWENFIPRNRIRVLLVEVDDSTRQIIGALLRKCNYKVATATDGLKAWEVLKARPHNVDLILTEMELPSISGYALLTLIMEHEICKNIPVIMMSRYDTMSMVYKCMMRGAVDFLVKPIRINELKNLWQHVWRRQSISRGGRRPQGESVAPDKLEATAENNATSNHSSGSKACASGQDECVKKGSDAQSSCGKLDLEAASAYTAEVEDFSEPKQGLSAVADLRIQEHHNCGHSGQNLYTSETAAADTTAFYGRNVLDREGMVEQKSLIENDDLCTQGSGNMKTLANSSREAIDLIGPFDKYSLQMSCSNDGAYRYNCSPQLDLSLRRTFPCFLENDSRNDKQMLNHSNASAFTRYVGKALHASNSNATSADTPMENKFDSADQISNHALENSNAKDPTRPYERKVVHLPVNPTSDTENASRNAPPKLFPIPLPVGGMQVDACATASRYGSTIPKNVFSPSLSRSPSSANQQINSYFQFSADMIGSRQQYNSLDCSPRLYLDQPIYVQDQKLESLEDRSIHSASSSFCNDNVGHSNGSVGVNEQSHVTHDLRRQGSLQREAALNKFRLKRKERCYEKKVRYESRKKLAEQRPRVKGQFVRQVPPDPPPLKSVNS